tara:strand:+ start:65 stop:469 length:405 start_codon:yes stop_codon:yes gene_type:complete
MSDSSFGAYRRGSAFADQRKADKIDQPSPRRGSGIFQAINENLRRKDEISYGAQEQRKTAKELAEQYKQKGSFKVNDDTTVMPGYQDPGFTLPGVQGRSFGGLIGTVGGAVLGGPLGIGAMQGAQLGGKVGSYF